MQELHQNSAEQINNRGDRMNHDNKYDEMYNEPKEPTNRLLSSKISRKKIELDAQALRNRILLLENEESKVMRKIEDTKRKALNIMHIKQKNREHDEVQQEFREYKKDVHYEKHNHVQEMRSELQKGVEEKRYEYLEDTKSKANEIKDSLQVKYVANLKRN